MAFSPDKFITNGLKFGGQRSNLFSAEIIFLNTDITRTEKHGFTSYSFLVSSASLPGYNVKEAEFKWAGRTVNLPTISQEMDPMKISIIHTSNESLRSKIQQYMDAIDHTVELTTNIIKTDKYKKNNGYINFSINTYTKSGNRNFKYIFEDSFITELGSLEFNHSSGNEFQQYDLTIRYMKYNIEKTNGAI